MNQRLAGLSADGQKEQTSDARLPTMQLNPGRLSNYLSH